MRVIFYLMKSLILFARPCRHGFLPEKAKPAAQSVRPARGERNASMYIHYLKRQSSSETVPARPMTMRTIPANIQFSSVGPRRICTKNVPRNCPSP